MKKVKKTYAICQNSECEKEFSFTPSKRKKYCCPECYYEDPKEKKKRRKLFSRVSSGKRSNRQQMDHIFCKVPQ